jgi:CBS domain-containing protein
VGAVSSATPLIGLDALVIDLETTDLDPGKAWVVEIAAARLAGGRVTPDAAFDRRIRPGRPIPPAATAIHGIDDDAVASAPAFAAVWPELRAYINEKVVIGHAIGFDLAVLKRECERAEIPWRRPRTLDTRLLAEVAEPELADYSLESLAAWLEIEISARHSALGDALACGRIFYALLPKLRAIGIRTLAEAEQACRALTAVLDEQHHFGWLEAVEAPIRADVERTFQRIDSFPYRHRVADIMRAPAQFLPANAPVRSALARMTGAQISSLYVRSPRRDDRAVPASECGIVTERDLLRALARHGADALDVSVERFMSKPLATVPADSFVYRAIARMSRLKIRHLAAIDDAGSVVGALSSRDLLRLRAHEAVSLGDEIDQAEDVHALAAAWAKLPRAAAALLAEAVPARDVAAVISHELGELTRQAAVLAQIRLRAEGRGDPPCPYAVAVLGSAGREESLLAMDQDNALFFAEGEPGSSEDVWFAAFGGHLAEILHEVGVPYCRGGVMASQPRWRGSLATWRARIADWIGRANPQDLLSVDIFFDLQAVHGDAGLAHGLREQAFAAAKGQAAFAKLLLEAAGAIEPGLTLFGRFRTDKGRIDLKRTGLFGIVNTARALAICHQVVERSTPARLAGIGALGIGGERDLAALAEAQSIFLELILSQQIEDIDHGTPASNAVAVNRLTRKDRDRLRGALRAVDHVDELARDLLLA